MMTRWRDDHGAATVEFALTLPLLMCLILGVITGGITLNQKIAVTNGVREGSRFGATLSVVSGCPSGPATMTCWLTQVADVTQAAAEGELNNDVASRSICVAYVHPSETTIPTDRTTRLVRDAAGDTVDARCPRLVRPYGATIADASGAVEYGNVARSGYSPAFTPGLRSAVMVMALPTSTAPMIFV